MNIGIEHQVMLSDNDYLDGVKFRTAKDQSNNVDIAHYTNLRFGFNVGNFSKRTEPLYWLNPMETVFSEIADLKARPAFEWIDEDNDGVLDLVDEELDTPEGCIRVRRAGVKSRFSLGAFPDGKFRSPNLPWTRQGR